MPVDTKKSDKDRIFWTTVVISFVLLVHNGNEPQFLVAMALLPFLIVLYLRKSTLLPLAMYLILFGFIGRYGRYVRETYASDTLLAIRDYIGYFLAGKSVYSNIVMAERGPTPFTYLPFALFWYLPAQILTIDLRFFEMIVSGFVPFLLFGIGRVVRTWRHLPVVAVVALTPFLLDLSADGSNDNSAIFLLLAAILLLVVGRSEKRKKFVLASAVFFGLSAAFKHYVWFFMLFLVPFLWRHKLKLSISNRTYLLILMVTVGIVSLPFILASPSGFWRSLFFIEIGNFHTTWGWNIWVGLQEAFDFVFAREFMWAVRTGVTVLTAASLFFLLKFNSLTHVIIAGSLTLLVYLLLSNWTTYAYFTFLVPLLGLAGLGL